MIVQKAFKFRFFPTDEQAAQLAKTFGCARYVYNQALEFRSTAWWQERKSIGYHTTAAKLTEWKKQPEKAFLSEVSSVVLRQSLRNLDTAFTNFFEKRAQYPKFKSRRDPPVGALCYECLHLQRRPNHTGQAIHASGHCMEPPTT